MRRERYAAAGVQLGAVPALGTGPLYRSVAALFRDESVLNLAGPRPQKGNLHRREKPQRCPRRIRTAADLRELAEQSSAWPFEEAKKIVARLKEKPKDEVIFETGYGPSGLPHIGTFGEVARTTMVRHAFRVLTGDRSRPG